MIKIGCVNIDVSHPKKFAEYFRKGERARYAAVYNDGFRTDDEVRDFMKENNIEQRFNNIDEMADNVDIGFIHSCNWDKHLEYAMPFINKGKPVFIDKPMVGTLKDCMKLEKLASEGKVILGSSCVRYCNEVTEFLARPKEERGDILNIFGTTGQNEFDYAIHIVEAICAMAESRPVSAKYVGGSCEKEGHTCDTYFIQFESGLTGTYNIFYPRWHPFEIVMMSTKGTFKFGIGGAYGPMLDRVCEYMESGKDTLATISQQTDSIKVLLAARISKEKDGIEVKITDIPADDPGYDGNKFEKEYAKLMGKK